MIEDYLIEEVRSLPMPDGTMKNVRSFKLTWANYDIVLEHGPLSAAELSALMLFYANKTGLDFGAALGEVLVPLRKQANRVLERDIKLRKRRLAMRADLRTSFESAVCGTVKPGEAKQPPKRSEPVLFRAIRGEMLR